MLYIGSVLLKLCHLAFKILHGVKQMTKLGVASRRQWYAIAQRITAIPARLKVILMKCIIVQLHTHKNAQYSLNECLEAVRAIGRHPEVEPEEETPSIVNLNFFTENPRAFWAEFQQKILLNTACGTWLKEVGIIVCEGEYGWNDALLLAHFDANEALDTL